MPTHRHRPATLSQALDIIAMQERQLEAFAEACYAVVTHENRVISAAHVFGLQLRRTDHGRRCLRTLNAYINRPCPGRGGEAQADFFSEAMQRQADVHA
jgi:hypothetical protein